LSSLAVFSATRSFSLNKETQVQQKKNFILVVLHTTYKRVLNYQLLYLKQIKRLLLVTMMPSWPWFTIFALELFYDADIRVSSPSHSDLAILNCTSKIWSVSWFNQSPTLNNWSLSIYVSYHTSHMILLIQRCVFIHLCMQKIWKIFQALKKS